MKACTWRLLYHIGDDYKNMNAAFSNEVEAYSSYSYHKEDIEARHVPTPTPSPEPGTETPTPTPSATPNATNAPQATAVAGFLILLRKMPPRPRSV